MTKSKTIKRQTMVDISLHKKLRTG